MFKKKLCGKCSLDGSCCCQNESQEMVARCGMEEVLESNANLNTRGQNYNNPDYEEFMNERF